jgi:carnitine O-acetyltransferase
LILVAEHELSKLVNTYQLKSERFEAFGSDFIKEAGFSPDAFIQMAIQLAAYRIFGQQVATYEASQVRSFLHGRTETTRPVSMESAAFVKMMGLFAQNQEGLRCREMKLELLRTATESHSSYLQKAAKGRGIDRHLFGLSMLVEESDEALPLFQHQLYQRSKRWRISTSTLPNNPGFGPVVSDGVGIGYTIHTHHCVFTLTASKESGPCMDSFSHLLEEALIEMRALVALDKTSIPKSKL